MITYGLITFDYSGELYQVIPTNNSNYSHMDAICSISLPGSPGDPGGPRLRSTSNQGEMNGNEVWIITIWFFNIAMEAMAHETDDKNDDLPSYKMVPVQKLYQKIILWNPEAQLKSSASPTGGGRWGGDPGWHLRSGDGSCGVFRPKPSSRALDGDFHRPMSYWETCYGLSGWGYTYIYI